MVTRTTVFSYPPGIILEYLKRNGDVETKSIDLLNLTPEYGVVADVICHYSLDKMDEFHKSHGKEGSIMVTQVEDPSKYGVVAADETNRIVRFVEKPKEIISNKIIAGLYLFNTNTIDRIGARPTSIEREIFAKMAEEGHIFQMILLGYWMDIG